MNKFFFCLMFGLVVNCTATGFTQEFAATVDTSTLKNKIMCGYQGWFNCPNDQQGLGWTHWWRNSGRPFGPGNVTVDLWPDVSELGKDELHETEFKLANGESAKVFSSANRKTVVRHFKWMRDYGIDGVFVQRFANGVKPGRLRDHKDTVLANVRVGAKKYGRAYAVMYDLSGLRVGEVDRVRQDWLYLQKKMRLAKDTSYQNHNGKPLVAIWGVGFKDGNKRREYALAEVRKLVAFFKSSGCSVMLGVPTGWLTQDRDAVSDPDLHNVLKLADVISPWTVGRYRDLKGIAAHSEKCLVADLKWCTENQLKYMPVVFPGFSWHNLTGEELNFIPRLKGQFLWSQIVAAKRVGCKMIYVAMFDEVDEGTAVFKCTNDIPVGYGVKFLDYEGLPSDHYLRLVGQGGKLLRGEAEISDQMPDGMSVEQMKDKQDIDNRD
jgi:hypothetical protein